MAKRTLPGLGLSGFWNIGASYKTGMDANMQLLSAVVQLSAKSRSSALPGSPSLGDIYIVPDSDPTNPNEIAVWDGEAGSEAWTYLEPAAGWIAYVQDDASHYLFTGSVWVRMAVSMTQPASTASYTVTEDDLAGGVVRRMNLSSAGDVTVAAGLTGTEPATFIQTGAGQITFVADSGVTIHSEDGNLKTRARYASVTLIPDADLSDTYYLIGGLAA